MLKNRTFAKTGSGQTQGKLTEKRRFSHRCETHDPKGVFRNDWFERLIFDDSEDHLKLVLPAEEVPAEASN